MVGIMTQPTICSPKRLILQHGGIIHQRGQSCFMTEMPFGQKPTIIYAERTVGILQRIPARSRDVDSAALYFNIGNVCHTYIAMP